MLCHPLAAASPLPPRLNNPFFYTPDALCQQAIDQLSAWLSGRPGAFADHPVSPDFQAEIAHGKMFGVLVCEGGSQDDHCGHNAYQRDAPYAHSAPQHPFMEPDGEKRLFYLAGYSGQICGRSDWDDFVPAVFDYLQPDGYFKRHEAEITALNHDIGTAEEALRQMKPMADDADDPRPELHKTRLDGEDEASFVRRRQFENAELHRWKLRRRQREAAAEEERRKAERQLLLLRRERHEKSDRLQRWLFQQFVMQNGRGERLDLIGIWQWWNRRSASAVSANPLPPAGSGECCEPKLLQYALNHGLRPVSMAMFWWGESPAGEVRHHLHCYPACRSKCRPILSWMLQGINVAENPLEQHAETDGEALTIIHEDEALWVVNKSAGLLSVPGKSQRPSVLSILSRRAGGGQKPYIVHRLDMDTSGLMVVAKTAEAYHDLQRQFAEHSIRKIYVALLEHPLCEARPDLPAEGIISLPLRPDLDDRPRQMVDFEHGRTAVSRYRMIDECRVNLSPLTGRTHQLRLHCAHRLGLNDPILGDRLYGHAPAATESHEAPARRLMLHAGSLTFRHPVTGRSVTFTAPAPF